ncbi:type II toxin-antitoxin system RelE/ParE family toxin [Azospirillum rugosum]|uniref:Toxin ParE1/3/4 n=1 Tax=Azospirillum rugosum TaxID=416170 RepID=A0ABS4SHN1_9PROT|nr:type II toxin-antitoxin system RelE/ParE family toxin [Azospirillum rugosum]MBP2291548.1 toxin ParE1/3/4 [Azospirillum rugosum]MDQ0525337.1 toxin ParE1/3/4 [Azospirillum rugosum]
MSGARPAFRLTRRAERDFADILTETVQRFGRIQFEAYRALLTTAIEAVAAMPQRPGSRPRDELARNVRTFHAALVGKRMSAARHVIVYRVGADGVVEILRLLHDSMDVRRHAVIPMESDDATPS